MTSFAGNGIYIACVVRVRVTDCLVVRNIRYIGGLEHIRPLKGTNTHHNGHMGQTISN